MSGLTGECNQDCNHQQWCQVPPRAFQVFRVSVALPAAAHWFRTDLRARAERAEGEADTLRAENRRDAPSGRDEPAASGTPRARRSARKDQ